jgi:hypothetical protein
MWNDSIFGVPEDAATDHEEITAMAVCDSGRYVAVGDRGGRITILTRCADAVPPEVAFLCEVQAYQPAVDPLRSVQVGTAVSALAWCRESETLLLSGNVEGCVKQWKIPGVAAAAGGRVPRVKREFVESLCCGQRGLEDGTLRALLTPSSGDMFIAAHAHALLAWPLLRPIPSHVHAPPPYSGGCTVVADAKQLDGGTGSFTAAACSPVCSSSIALGLHTGTALILDTRTSFQGGLHSALRLEPWSQFLPSAATLWEDATRLGIIGTLSSTVEHETAQESQLHAPSSPSLVDAHHGEPDSPKAGEPAYVFREEDTQASDTCQGDAAQQVKVDAENTSPLWLLDGGDTTPGQIEARSVHSLEFDARHHVAVRDLDTVRVWDVRHVMAPLYAVGVEECEDFAARREKPPAACVKLRRPHQRSLALGYDGRFYTGLYTSQMLCAVGGVRQPSLFEEGPADTLVYEWGVSRIQFGGKDVALMDAPPFGDVSCVVAHRTQNLVCAAVNAYVYFFRVMPR